MPANEQGITQNRYMCIPRTLIFLMRGNLVLLLKGASTKRIWANKYNGVGGHVERGEDILSSAKRELYEETGLYANLHLAGTLQVDVEPNTGICVYIFTGEYFEGELHSSEEGTLEWIPFEELDNYDLVEDVAVLLERIRSMEIGESPFSARSFYDKEDKLTLRFEK